MADAPLAPSPLAADDIAAPLLLDHGGGRSSPVLTVLPLLALAIGLVLLVVVVLTRWGKPRSVGGSSDSPPVSTCVRIGTRMFTYKELERATEGFSEDKVLGQGTHGVVFRGRLDDGTPAAIKRLRHAERQFRLQQTGRLSSSILKKQHPLSPSAELGELGKRRRTRKKRRGNNVEEESGLPAEN